MVDIEPYQYQKTTNIKEHNDIVAKINEIVNVVNNTDLENIGTKIDAIEATDTLQWKDIESIKAKDTEQDSTLATHTSEITELTKSLVSNVALMNGTTAGNMKVRIERESAPFIDSNDYNIQKPTSVELVQGSAPAMVKAQITLSDGTVLISDDFMFTTEAIGQDVYISSFVFKNGNVAGTISADIGLSNGSTLTANNFAVPTDPNVLSTIADLTSRTEALEQVDIGALKTTVDGHTASIEALNNDVTDIMLNKADVNNVNQVIVAKQIDLESIVRIESQSESAKFGLIGGNPTHPFTVTHETEAFGQIVDKPIGTIAMLDINGNPKNFTVGEVWEEVNLSKWPTDWVAGEIIRIDFKTKCVGADPYVSTDVNATSILEVTVSDIAHSCSVEKLINIKYESASKWDFVYLTSIETNNFNTSSNLLMHIRGGNTSGSKMLDINKTNISTYVRKMWRKRP